MNRFIRRIGDASARRPWTTIGMWAVLAALVVSLSGAFGGVFADDFSAPGSESARATARSGPGEVRGGSPRRR